MSVTPQAAGNSTVQVQLVDYGAATIRIQPGNDVGIDNPMTTQSCFGGYTADDTGCFFDTPATLVNVTQQVIALGVPLPAPSDAAPVTTTVPAPRTQLVPLV